MSELTKEQAKKLNKLANALITAKAQAEQCNIEAELIKKDLIQSMNECEVKSFLLKDSGNKPKSIILAEKMNITYDIEKMKEKLGKEMFAEVVNKTVTITNLDQFIQIMKKYEVPYPKVKGLLNVQEAISNAKINELYKMGDLSLKKIKGCYEVSFTEYISVR